MSDTITGKCNTIYITQSYDTLKTQYTKTDDTQADTKHGTHLPMKTDLKHEEQRHAE